MKIHDIIQEDADVGTTMSGNFASISFPLFGKKKMIRRAVDPNNYLGKMDKPYTGGYNKKVEIKNANTRSK